MRENKAAELMLLAQQPGVKKAVTGGKRKNSNASAAQKH